MSRRSCALSTAALVLMGWLPPGAQAQTEINWFVTDWPPLFIYAKGQPPARPADLGEGQIDRVMAELIARLPDYRHRFEPLNSRRLWRAIAEGQPLCTAAALKTPERSALAYFTPTLRVAPLMLVVRADRAEEFLAADGRASLAALHQRPDLRGRLEAERSYGPQLDPLLAGPLALPRDSTSRIGQVAEMVAAGRFDYTLDFAHTIEYLRRDGRLSEPLAALPLQEAGGWSLGYVACPRTPWGLAAITAIDQAIRQAAATRAYREAYARWLPEGLRSQQKAQMEAFFDARAKGGAQIE